MTACLYRRRAALAMIAAIAMVSLVGCGDGRTARFPVSGKVLIDGQPLEHGFIQVVPEGDRAATAQLGPGGVFQLTTYTPNDGCVPGTHKVTVIANESQGPYAMKWFAPKRYADPATADLTIEVAQARDDVVINLSWDGGQPFVEKFESEGEMPQGDAPQGDAPQG